MDLRKFVADNQSDWELLRSYMRRYKAQGLGALSRDELRELGMLHRKVAADLSAVRSAHPGSRLVGLLNDLALRSHNAVYQAPRRGLLRSLADLFRAVPATVRRRKGALFASTMFFGCGSLFGVIGTLVDESFAVLVLGERFVTDVQEGHYWIERTFSVLPHSVATAGITTNNLSVAMVMFALGITGIMPAWLLFLNGLNIGAVVSLCASNGLFDRFVPFVVPHGIIEISAILVAGAGAFVVFDGWIQPGEASRLEGLKKGAREGLLIAFAAIPALLVAGPVEGFISPVESTPGLLRIALGVALGMFFWGWILGRGRSAANETTDGRVA